MKDTLNLTGIFPEGLAVLELIRQRHDLSEFGKGVAFGLAIHAMVDGRPWTTQDLVALPQWAAQQAAHIGLWLEAAFDSWCKIG